MRPGARIRVASDCRSTQSWLNSEGSQAAISRTPSSFVPGTWSWTIDSQRSTFATRSAAGDTVCGAEEKSHNSDAISTTSVGYTIVEISQKIVEIDCAAQSSTWVGRTPR